MKKKTVLLLAFLFTLVCCVWSVAEESEKTEITSGDYTYIVLDDGTAEIKWYSGTVEELVIPDTLDGISVTRIGDYAFVGWKSMTSITIPDSVTGIGANPFVDCNKLTDIIVSPDHPYLATTDGVLFSKPDKRLVCYPSAFTADSYSIPNGIQIIGVDAFDYCESLKDITIPDSVTGIGDGAFFRCSSLANITIPDSVTGIGRNPFAACYKLTNIMVSPDHPYLETIDGVLFSKPDRRLVCCPCAFTAESYTIPDGIQIIGDFAFYHCESLTGIIIPDSVIRIGDDAFLECSSLTGITIPNSVAGIGEETFYGCSSLTGITIPDSVTRIGDSAFELCESLTATVSHDSYAAQYCKDNNIKYAYAE